MKYIPSASFKAFLEREFTLAKKRLGISHYSVDFEFVAKIPSYKHSPQKSGATFEVTDDQTYFQLEVKVSKKAQTKFEQGQFARLIDDISHECAHVLVNPLADFAGEHLSKSQKEKLSILEEGLTQRIADISLKNFNAFQ